MSTMHSFKKPALIGLAALGLGISACGPADTARSQTISITPAAIPSRYAAPLPTTSAELERWLRQESSDMAPVSHVVDSVLMGNPEWLARLRTAADAVAENDRAAWVRPWFGLFEFEVPTPSFCSQTRAAMAGASSAFRDVISLSYARSCLRAEDAALILRGDTPSPAVLEYFDPWSGVMRPFDSRIGDAARDVIVNGDSFDARRAAFTLIAANDPRADEALLEIHSAIQDAARADEVALAFLRSDNDEGKARAQAACRRNPRDTMCSSDQQNFAEEPRTSTDEEAVPMDAIAARIKQLGDAGFAKVGAVKPDEVGSDVAEEILLAAGHAYWFDVETGFYPNQHDSLMRHLAALLSPDLDDVVFEEIAPDIEDESGPYELLAYSNGKLLRTEAQNLDDWYDVDAVLGLMNAMMMERNHAARFTVLATGDQTAIVVAAPPGVVARAVQAGLLERGDPGEAERVGKEFEERVLESLQN